MKEPAVDEVLARTLESGALTRAERTELASLVERTMPHASQRGALRAKAFDEARARLEGGLSPTAASALLGWLEDVVRISIPAEAKPTRLEVLESPGERPWRRIVSLVSEATRSIDVCVFTVTHDPITRALADADRRGVRVRIVSDDEKAREPGSDLERLARAGVEVRVDEGPALMHHKLALFDDRVVLTGSYNWTRAAAESNHDNVLVTDDPRAIAAYRSIFDRMWEAGLPLRRGVG